MFVHDLEGPALDDDDAHHLTRVLRLRAGEQVSAVDGMGGWRLCTYQGGSDLRPAGDVVRLSAPAPPLAVAFALTKGDRPEWTVQKLTEIGVDRIIPMVTERTEVRWEPARCHKQLSRLRKIARQAAMQSRRLKEPTIDDLQSPAVVAELLPGLVGRADPAGDPPTLERPCLLVGPAGGWSPTEAALDMPMVALGPGVLRAETAALAAGVLLVALRQGLVGRPPGVAAGP